MNSPISRVTIKIIASFWAIVGLVASIFLARDLLSISVPDWSPPLIALALFWLAFVCGCFSFSYALFRSQAFGRTIGMALALVAGLGTFVYLALNILVLVKIGSLNSVLFVAVGAVGVVFSVISFRVARKLQPNPAFENGRPQAGAAQRER